MKQARAALSNLCQPKTPSEIVRGTSDPHMMPVAVMPSIEDGTSTSPAGLGQAGFGDFKAHGWFMARPLPTTSYREIALGLAVMDLGRRSLLGARHEGGNERPPGAPLGHSLSDARHSAIGRDGDKLRARAGGGSGGFGARGDEKTPGWHERHVRLTSGAAVCRPHSQCVRGLGSIRRSPDALFPGSRQRTLTAADVRTDGTGKTYDQENVHARGAGEHGKPSGSPARPGRARSQGFNHANR